MSPQTKAVIKAELHDLLWVFIHGILTLLVLPFVFAWLILKWSFLLARQSDSPFSGFRDIWR